MPRTFEGNLVSPKGRFAVCVSRFNSFITEQLLSGALDALIRHGVKDDAIDVYRCPGTFELCWPSPSETVQRRVRPYPDCGRAARPGRPQSRETF